MAKKSPGKGYRQGISLIELFEMFPDNETAKKWFEEKMWPDGPKCPYCGTHNVQSNIKHKTMTHRCRECEGRPMFTVKMGTVMEGSNISYRKWAIAIYLVSTSLKGVSSMKLHRDLKISQKTAWHMLHRIRKAYETDNPLFEGPVEVDETYAGGKRKNMSLSKRKEFKDLGRGTAGKRAVVGIKDRETNKVAAKSVENTEKSTLHNFVFDHADPNATVYTDEHKSYIGLPFHHETVNHSAKQYVRDMAHTNGIESFWSMLKRGYTGTYHRMSFKHLDRYVTEFAGRHNVRELNTHEQMAEVAVGMIGKSLTYKELVG